MTRAILDPIRDASFAFGIWPWAKGPLWRLRETVTFAMPAITLGDRYYYGGDYIIPAGYETDKASIPSLFWGPPFNYTPDGIYTDAALWHDFLCDLLKGGSPWLRETLGGKLPPAPPAWAVHEFFRQELHKAGVRSGKAEGMGTAVRWFGPKGKAYFWQKK